MKKIKSALMMGAVAMAASISLPQNAEAFLPFGPVCIPNPYNCNCTFIMPCPVLDPIQNARMAIENSDLKSALKMMQDIRDPQDMLLKAIQGEGSFSIPGLNSIGLDLNGLDIGQFSSSVTQMASELNGLGIDVDMITAMASGELKPKDFLNVAISAGIDMPQLEKLGLDAKTIVDLAEGKLSTGAMLDLATNLGIQGKVLNNLGISEKLIQDVAAGVADPQQILSIAQSAGLDMAALERVGLDVQSIRSLASGASPDVVMSILQKSGYDNSPITALGLDAGMIGQIASGKLPPEAIHNLVAGTGIDPSSVVIPGADGPISIPGERPSNALGLVAIPATSIPGLENVLEQAKGTAATGSTAAASAAEISPEPAMCLGDLSLISVTSPPNDFGDEVDMIDMAISGADLSTFGENLASAETASASTAALGIARSMTVRPLITAALDSVDDFEAMMNQAMSAKDDFVVNDTIKAQLMTAKAETTSIMTSLLSVKAAKRLDREFITPVPLLPEGSRYGDAVEEIAEMATKEDDTAADELKRAAQDQAEFHTAAKEALVQHAMVQDAAEIERGFPDLMPPIESHEALKAQQVKLEATILPRMTQLYGSGADAAWDIARQKISSGAGSYYDGKKYENGFALAKELSKAITANTATTEYGQRVRSSGGRYSEATETAYEYGEVDTGTSLMSESYAVASRQRVLIKDRDRDGNVEYRMPPNMELVGALQYYIELTRRLENASELRRGSASVSMTSQFWKEMYNNAPQCLTGPLPTTAANLAKRPDLFDLAPNCEHLTWANGDSGDYIDASALGGTDAVIWMSKISAAKAKSRTGGPENVLKTISAVIEMGKKSDIVARLEALDLKAGADHSRRVTKALEAALADSSFTKKIEFPRE